jgi:hypothetical protein
MVSFMPNGATRRGVLISNVALELACKKCFESLVSARRWAWIRLIARTVFDQPGDAFITGITA